MHTTKNAKKSTVRGKRPDGRGQNNDWPKTINTYHIRTLELKKTIND